MADRNFFPPYFLEVSLAWALGVMPLACGATMLAARSAEAPAPPATVAEEVPPREAPTVKAPEIVAAVQTLDDGALAHPLVVEGSAKTADQLAADLADFRACVHDFEAAGYHVGLVICDLGSRASLAYGADEYFYPASSIKGPYVIAVYETMVEAEMIAPRELSALVEPIIVESDNDAYRALRDLCGSELFAIWAADAGAIEVNSHDYKELSDWYYPPLTARQLALMWEHAFVYLGQGSEGARELVDYFERRVESPLRAGVGDDCVTISKAGWYPEDDGGYSAPSTCDAGLVFDDGRAYVVAIMTDAPGDLDQLTALVPGLYSAHVALE